MRMVKLILCSRCGVMVNREVGDVEDGCVCFACREREEMKGEISKAQADCVRAGGEARGVGSVEREGVNSST